MPVVARLKINGASVAFRRMADADRELVYVDTSALVKLVVREAETDALEAELRLWTNAATSALTQVELPRAVRRKPLSDIVNPGYVFAILAATREVPLSDEVLDMAAELDPPDLGTLDAIHLASALSLGSAVDAVITYDKQLRQAVTLAGLELLVPA
jgi:predicted nucleic acid-binding protein